MILHLAIDPGLVTGVGIYSDAWSKPMFWEVTGGLRGFVEWFETKIGVGYDFTQIYIEDWTVRPNTHKLTPQPDPYLIIGYVQGRCIVRGTPFQKIGPGMHKSFNGSGKASKVRRIGWITEKTKDDHAEDAASILLTGMLRTERELIAPLLKEI